eukprot:301667-Rhodomonas_salina.1
MSGTHVGCPALPGQFPKAAMVVRADAEVHSPQYHAIHIAFAMRCPVLTYALRCQVEPVLVQMEGRKGGITREGKGGHGVAYVNMGLWGGKGHSNVRWLIVLLMARKVPPDAVCFR